MSNHLFYLLLSIVILSCQNVNKKQIPDKILTENEMTLVLIDVAQLKVIKTNYLKEFKETGINANQYLCDKYDVDSITLEKNLKYYNYEPEELKKIYERVYDSLEKSKNIIADFIDKRKNKEEDKIQDKENDTLNFKAPKKRYPSSTDLKNKTRN